MIAGLLPLSMKAQQMPQLSQYMFNKYLINPAVAGTSTHTKIKLGYRYQWIGFDKNVPQTINFSVFGPFEEKSMGWGASAYADIWGPTSRMGALGTYTYNLAVYDEYRLSAGASFGIMQFKMNGSQIDLGDDLYDPYFTGNDIARVVPDGNIGLYFYSSSLYAGFAAHQLFGNKMTFTDTDTQPQDEDELKGLNRLRQHFYFSAGKIFLLNADYRLDSYMLIKGSYPGVFQWELSAQVAYQNTIWGGISYRHKDALSFLVGGNVDNITFGFSYDFVTTQISPLTSGTIELMVGFNFDAIRN